MFISDYFGRTNDWVERKPTGRILQLNPYFKDGLPFEGESKTFVSDSDPSESSFTTLTFLNQREVRVRRLLENNRQALLLPVSTYLGFSGDSLA